MERSRKIEGERSTETKRERKREREREKIFLDSHFPLPNCTLFSALSRRVEVG